MQQNQNKSEASTKNSNSFGKMMLQKDKNRFQMQEKQAYIESLKAPRGKEYFRLLGKIKEVAEQLADVDEKIEKLQQEIAQEKKSLQETQAQEGKPEQDSMPWMSDTLNESTVSWLEDAPKDSTVSRQEDVSEESTTSWLEDAPKESTASWLTDTSKEKDASWLGNKESGEEALQRMKEKEQQLLELQQKLRGLEEEYQKEQKSFIEQLPAPDRFLYLIWCSINTGILMKYGMIGCSGTSFNSEEELLDISKPKSEQEERQILKGNAAYQKYYAQYGEDLLVVEIYMDAICVVFKDGNTIVIE